MSVPIFRSIGSALDVFAYKLNKFEKYLLPEDIEFCCNYIKLGDQMLQEGAFDNLGALSKMEWCEYNFRYGIQSIRGTVAEMVGIALLRQHASGNGTTYIWSPSNKAIQVSGIDARLENPAWNRPYCMQMKTFHLGPAMTSFQVSNKWFDKFADRIALVNPQSEIVLMCDMVQLYRVTEHRPYVYVEKLMTQSKKLHLYISPVNQ